MIIERIYSEHGAQDPGIYENRSVYPSPDYHGRTGLANEDDRLLRRNSSPASSTSSISNPALLAIERPTSPTRETPTGWEVVKALLRTVYATAWLCGGAALLGLVGHSVGWVVLHNAFATSDADASTRTDVACAVRPGVFGAVVLSVPSVIAYLAVLRRGQPQTRAQGSVVPSGRGVRGSSYEPERGAQDGEIHCIRTRFGFVWRVVWRARVRDRHFGVYD